MDYKYDGAAYLQLITDYLNSSYIYSLIIVIHKRTTYLNIVIVL